MSKKKKSDFISYEKMSKKKQKEIDRQGRTTWDINPITRKEERNKQSGKK